MAGFCGTGKRDHKAAPSAADSGRRAPVVHYLFSVRNMFFWDDGYWSVLMSVAGFDETQWPILNFQLGGQF
jgi:hypothetical protein